MATMSDIAEAAGVSITTVSRVLAGKDSPIPIATETRTRVLRAADTLNYQPNIFAQSLRGKKSWFVGAIIWDFVDPFFGEILRGIRSVLSKTNHHLILDSASGDAKGLVSAVEWVARVQPAGILIVGGPRLDPLSEQIALAVGDSPVVLLGTKVDDRRFGSVIVDNFQAGIMGADHCLNKPHRLFRFITFVSRTSDEEARRAGVIQALERRGYGDYRSGIVEVERGVEETYQMARRLFRRYEGPISLFVNDDQSAIAVMRAAFDLGLRVPEDVSILGCDGLEIGGYTERRLSTVVQPRFEIGAQGAEVLIDQMERRETEDDTETKAPELKLLPSLLLRESA